MACEKLGKITMFSIERKDALNIIAHFVVAKTLIFIIAVMVYELALPVTNDVVAFPDISKLKEYFHNLHYWGDAGWYEGVASNGYDKIAAEYSAQHNWVFFPFLPVLLSILGGPATLALVYLSVCLSSILMYQLVSHQYDKSIAKYTVLLFIYSPFSYVLTAYRPEAMMLLLWLGATHYFLQRNYLLSAVLVFFAALCKTNGFIIVAYLGTVFLMQSYKNRKICWVQVLPLLSPFIALVIFSAYIGSLTGDPLAWMKGQQAWGAELFAQPVSQILQLFEQPLLVDRWGWNVSLVNWFFFIACNLVALCLFKKDLPASLFIIATSMASFLNFGVWVHGRHMIVVWPVFMGLAILFRQEDKRQMLLQTSACILSLFVALNALGVSALRA